MDKNVITTIKFLIQFAVRIYTLYYTFRYKAHCMEVRNKISEPFQRDLSSKLKTMYYVGLKNTPVSLEIIVLRDFEYHQSIPY